MCLQRHSFTLGQLEEYFREGACTQMHARVFTSRFLHCFPCVTFFLRRYLFNLFCTLRTETFMFDSSYPIFDRAYPCYTALPLTLLPHDMRLLHRYVRIHVFVPFSITFLSCAPFWVLAPLHAFHFLCSHSPFICMVDLVVLSLRSVL